MAPDRGRRFLRHGNLKGSHFFPIVGRILKGNLEERREKLVGKGRATRSSYDVVGTSSFVIGTCPCFWSDNKYLAWEKQRYRGTTDRTLEDNSTKLGFLFMDHRHCLFIS